MRTVILLSVLSLFVLSLFAVSAKAQTYSSPAPFTCDAASLHPVTSFYQFNCRGIRLATWTTSTLSVVGTFFLFNTGSRVEVVLPPNISPDPGDYFNSTVTQLDSFTEPSRDQPGTFEFEWQQDNADESHVTGTASGTWEDYVICGGRGCQYHAPKLLTFTTTVN
jgi:hypothetical protein